MPNDSSTTTTEAQMVLDVLGNDLIVEALALKTGLRADEVRPALADLVDCWAAPNRPHRNDSSTAPIDTANLREKIDAVAPNYGSEHCICGPHATSDRECPVHWAIAILEREGLYR